ncbi:MAG: DUF3365 domain-containing protein [SAR324 cluster bacterium]|nr:DUF3365 domain-containing protein [SAR324 cluster bacterium]
MEKSNSAIQKRVFLIFLGVTLFFVTITAVLLPYKLYLRDVQETRTRARSISDLIRIGLLSTMIATGDPEKVRGLIADFEKKHEFKFRMVRSSHVEKQHGINEDEQATDELIKQVLVTGKSRDDWLNRTTFRYVAPFIADSRCQECHESVKGSTIHVGDILGASEIIFDLSAKEADSIRLIVEVVLLIMASLITMGIIFYFIVKKGILEKNLLIERDEL